MSGSNILKFCFNAHNANSPFIFDGVNRYDLGVNVLKICVTARNVVVEVGSYLVQWLIMGCR